MARRLAKRANKPNPREDRNQNFDLPEFIVGSIPKGKHKQRRERNSSYQSSDNLNNQNLKAANIKLIPKSINQEKFIEALEDTSKSIVVTTGPAGVGKSFLHTLYAIREFELGNFDKIIITRPAIGVDGEEHGFLPGGIDSKMMPWVMPILSIMQEYYTSSQIEKMLETNKLVFLPLAFCRGLTFKNSIVILDECQNLIGSSLKTYLSRLGEGSRILVGGDINQHDRGNIVNGLLDFTNRLKKHPSKYITLCELTKEDIQRHPCVTDILKIYGEE